MTRSPLLKERAQCYKIVWYLSELMEALGPELLRVLWHKELGNSCEDDEFAISGNILTIINDSENKERYPKFTKEAALVCCSHPQICPLKQQWTKIVPLKSWASSSGVSMKSSDDSGDMSLNGWWRSENVVCLGIVLGKCWRLAEVRVLSSPYCIWTLT